MGNKEVTRRRYPFNFKAVSAFGLFSRLTGFYSVKIRHFPFKKMSFRHNHISQEDFATATSDKTTDSQTLETQIRRQITYLHQLKSSVQKIQRELQTNVTKVKGEVGSSFSRHLEALRNREVWLLDQVDTIHTAKEEVLQDQLAVLNHLTGSLATLLTHTTHRDDTLPRLADQLHKISQQIDRLCPEPAEDSGLSFSANRGKLRSAICHFGCIDSSPSSTLLLMASHSLPAPFEDYGDGEQQMSYKSVNSQQNVYKVAVPKLIPQLDGFNVTQQQTVPPSSQKTPAEASVGGVPHDYGYFTQVAASSKEDWLPENMENKEHLFKPLHYFREVCQMEDKDWLTTDDAASKPDYCVPVCCLSTPVKSSLEIEDLAELDCLSPSTPDPDNLQTWLYKKHNCDDEKEGEEIPDDNSDLTSLGRDFEKIDMVTSLTPAMTPDIQAVCRANECCSSFADCLCDFNCGGLQQSNSLTNWLPAAGQPQLSDQSQGSSQLHPATVWYQSVSNSLADWLCPDQPQPSNQSLDSSQVNNPLALWYRTVSNSLSDWLPTARQGHCLAQSAVFRYFQMMERTDLSQWLHNDLSTSATATSTTTASPACFDRFREVTNQSSSQWLAAANQLTEGEEPDSTNQTKGPTHYEQFGYFQVVQDQLSSTWLISSQPGFPKKVDPCTGEVPDTTPPVSLGRFPRDNVHSPTPLKDSPFKLGGQGSDWTSTWLPGSPGAEDSLKYLEEIKEKPLAWLVATSPTFENGLAWAEMQKGSSNLHSDYDHLFSCFRQPFVAQDWLH